MFVYVLFLIVIALIVGTCLFLRTANIEDVAFPLDTMSSKLNIMKEGWRKLFTWKFRKPIQIVLDALKYILQKIIKN